MRVGIIGGSIAGCATAALLHRAGHDVIVFERSESDLVSRGAGIQAVYSVAARSYARDRGCLVGDAGAVFPPVHRERRPQGGGQCHLLGRRPCRRPGRG